MKFFDLTHDLFLYQHVEEFTRFRLDQEPSLLDLVFTNEETMVDNIEFSSPIGKSDHVSITWTFHSSTYTAQSQEQSEKRAWYKTDYHSFNEYILSIDWENRLKDLDVENSWEVFKAEYEKGVQMYVPYKNNCKNRQSPWFSKKVKEAVRKKTCTFQEI